MDGDSPMSDSPADSPSSAAFVPSDSQAEKATRNMAVHSSNANANGKRPLHDISNGADGEFSNPEQTMRMGVAPAGSTTEAAANTQEQVFVEQVHASGYKWTKPEDAPGYGWYNKKASEEYSRAVELLVHKEHMVKGWLIIESWILC